MKKIKLIHPAVFIFGAGATRGGLENKESTTPAPPVDSDFFEIINHLKGRGTPEFSKKILQSVWELYGKIHGIGLEQYYRDIETRAIILRFTTTKKKPKDWSKRQEKLEELIRRAMIHTTCEENKQHVFSPKHSEPHKDILKNIKKGDTLITFNYDMVIEESFDNNCNVWSPLDGYGARVQGQTFDWCRIWLRNRATNKNNSSSVHLLKLHGSLNWRLLNNKKISLKARPYLVREKKSEEISILPPGWNKRIDRKPYKDFWKEAKTKLSDCNSLVILGYSLPETDLLAQALFAEVVRWRRTLTSKKKGFLKVLCLAEPKTEVKEKFVNLFTPILSSHSKIYKYETIENFAKTFAAL